MAASSTRIRGCTTPRSRSATEPRDRCLQAPLHAQARDGGLSARACPFRSSGKGMRPSYGTTCVAFPHRATHVRSCRDGGCTCTHAKRTRAHLLHMFPHALPAATGNRASVRDVSKHRRWHAITQVSIRICVRVDMQVALADSALCASGRTHGKRMRGQSPGAGKLGEDTYWRSGSI